MKFETLVTGQAASVTELCAGCELRSKVERRATTESLAQQHQASRHSKALLKMSRMRLMNKIVADAQFGREDRRTYYYPEGVPVCVGLI